MVIATIANAQLHPVTTFKVIENGDTLQNPWTGGFDLPQFTQEDIDADGVEDIIVFDKKGESWKIFLRKNGSYVHAPQYDRFFPDAENKGFVFDFDDDGTPDIFAGVPGGLKIYKGERVSGGIQFNEIIAKLKYNTGFGQAEIFVKNEDIPAIEDFDGDGDLDIASFDVLGSNLPYFRNFSAENGYGLDSLIYEEFDPCWGDFKENASDNGIQMNISCKGATGSASGGGGARHSGSTIMAFDHDLDGDMDLTLGDVSFDGLVYLNNGGDAINSLVTSFDTAFPIYNTPVEFSLFPAGYWIDYDLDGTREVIACPNGKTNHINTDNIWLYERGGNASAPYEFVQKDFLTNSTIDVGSYSYPQFFDYNADGLKDLLISNDYIFHENGGDTSRLFLYENIGTTTEPMFELVSTNFANMKNANLELIRPAFGDLDNDGDEDMLIGERQGYLHYYENTAGAGNTVSFSLAAPLYFNIKAGNQSHPFLYDMNKDGLLDIVVGKDELGKIEYYWNMGTTANAIFHKDSLNDNLGEISIGGGFIDGRSTPFVREEAGETYLYSGNNFGEFYKFRVDENNLRGGTFPMITSNVVGRQLSEFSTIFIDDVNADGEDDYLLGSIEGGLYFYSTALLDSSLLISIRSLEENPYSLVVYPNPASDIVQVQISNVSEFLGSTLQIEVFDNLGKNVHVDAKVFTNETEIFSIQTNDWAKGIYYVKIDSNGKLLGRSKMIK